MDIFLIYLLKTLLLPVASLLLLALFAVFYIRERTFPLWIIAFSVFTLLCLSLPFVSGSLASIQEKYSPLDTQRINRFSAQAIVVLGGGLRYPAPEYPSKVTVKTMALERLRYAAFLAKNHHIPILVSGGKVFSTSKFSEAEVMARVLQEEFKVAVKWQEDKSRNTAENAFYSGKMLSQAGVDKVLLVTHAFHMDRALTQFKMQGLDVLPGPTAFISSSNSAMLLDFLPSAKAISESTLIIHEMLGQIWYSIRY